MKKKILAMLLAVVMIMAMLPTAFAADENSGTCGENVTWTYSDGVLTIEGSGPMDDYLPSDYLSEDGSFNYNNPLNVLKVRPWENYAYDIKTIKIGSGVTSIGTGAFLNVDAVTAIIPATVKSIGILGFAHIMAFPTLEDVYYAGSESQWKQIAIYDYDCDLDYAEYHYESTGPDPTEPETPSVGVTYSVTDGVLTIEGEGPMDNYSFVADNPVRQPWFYDYYRDIHTVIIKNGVTSIGNYAFYTHSNLTGVTIPESVAAIGEHAFDGCSSLTSITIPNGVITIGARAFPSSLTSVTIPGSVADFTSAFSGCSKLTSVVFSEGLMSISPDAFYGCRSLTDVTIPESVNVIGSGAFSSCSGLTGVVIPDGVTSIEEHTFNSCTSLASVTIPVSVTSIDGWAFFNCTSLTEVYYGGSESQWEEITLRGGNDPLTSANITYNSTGPDTTEPTDPTEPEPEAPEFNDVPAAEWYADAVNWAAGNGITDGTGGGQFSPERACTEVEILTMLYRAHSDEAAGDSSDLDKAVEWAQEKGLTGSEFESGAACSRAAAVKYIWKINGEESAEASSFADVDAEADYADAVNWAVANSITDGTGGNRVSPERTCTRAEIVTLLFRAYANTVSE